MGNLPKNLTGTVNYTVTFKIQKNTGMRTNSYGDLERESTYEIPVDVTLTGTNLRQIMENLVYISGSKDSLTNN